MGTSSIFQGNNDKNPLLPSDYEEQSQQEKPLKPVTWKAVKTNMSKYVTSSGTHGSPSHIIRQAIKVNGGARRMTSNSISGIHAASNLGSFFANIRERGVFETLLQLGIECEGKSVGEIFSRLVSVISSDSTSKEDIVAREASQVALSNIYDYIAENNLDFSCVDHMPIEIMDKAMKAFLTEYIWGSIMRDLECRIEQYMKDSSSACEREQELKDTIEAIVDVEYDKHGSLIQKNVQEAVHILLERCLIVLEGII